MFIYEKLIGRIKSLICEKFLGVPESMLLNKFYNEKDSCTDKSFRNLIYSNRNQIVFTMHRLIWNIKRTCPFDVPNQSENGEYNLLQSY